MAYLEKSGKTKRLSNSFNTDFFSLKVLNSCELQSKELTSENNKEFSKAKRYITQLEKRIRELESFIQNWHETDGE